MRGFHTSKYVNIFNYSSIHPFIHTTNINFLLFCYVYSTVLVHIPCLISLAFDGHILLYLSPCILKPGAGLDMCLQWDLGSSYVHIGQI